MSKFITIKMSQHLLKSRVIQLYKRLIYLGREYPGGPAEFRQKCHNEFYRNREIVDAKEIKKLVLKGEYMCKELEALYSLKKYRAMKKRYYD